MNPLAQLMHRVPGLQQLLLLVGLAAAVAGGIGAYMWLRGPTYTTAFTHLAPADAMQVTQALGQAGIAYRVDADGDVQVAAAQLTTARMKLGAKGLPATSDGLASLSKNTGFGVSQFMQNARYNYALETDLANTIGKLTGVARAKVHLAIPQPSAFIDSNGQPSASVLVQLVPGAHLRPPQVSAITHLVASSVPDLPATRVAVVDQSGQLLSANAPDSSASRTAREMQLTKQYERGIDAKVVNLLTPIVGQGRVRVQSHADVDYSTAEQASETYHPNPQAVRSESISSHGAGTGGKLAQGVPGAFSNQPKTPTNKAGNAPRGTRPVAATPPTSAASSGAAPTAVAVTRDESRQYAIGRSITHTKQTQGRLKRLSVAVLIDDRPQTGTDGKTKTAVGITAAQLASIKSLVQSAVGYDQARGDMVTVVNADFLDQAIAAPKLPPATPTPWWQHGWVMDVARNGLAIIALLLVAFFVIRPALRLLLGGMQPSDPEALGAEIQPALAGTAQTAALGGPQRRSYDEKVQIARDAVAHDPKRVAQVVHNWVGNDG